MIVDEKRLSNVINLEGIYLDQTEVSPLELWRYYYETGVLFHNGMVKDATQNYFQSMPLDLHHDKPGSRFFKQGDAMIECVDLNIPEGKQRFFREFHLVQPGLKGRVKDNLRQTLIKLNTVSFYLTSYAENLDGINPEQKQNLLDLLTDEELRKEVAAL